jgi:very-short-patch-repair endonuclease/Ni2+-binding GTPase involved in maturation of urease and hydrogenase
MAYNALYFELLDYCKKLKEKEAKRTGKTPRICTADSLKEMSELKPRGLSDLKAISGIGNTFIENYGEGFLEIIKKYVSADVPESVEMSGKAVETLKELEKKLVNLNRRNRLLYMPKLVSKYGYDLYTGSDCNALDLIFGKKRQIVLSDLANTDSQELGKNKRLTTLARETNKDIRDRGQNDLYIGYPFAKGRLPGEEFDIRCPLVLFPATIDKTPTKISIELDDSRDILYNNALLLAYFKFNNISKALPDNGIDSVDEASFIENTLSYFKEQGISINNTINTIKKFQEYKAGEFPKYASGEVTLEPVIVLGKYPVCSSSIQKDFDGMIEQGNINSLLNELLLEVNDYDYDSAYYGEKEITDKEENYEISEKRLTYINNLDSSQENVLNAIDETDKLVVQGPPGTGKSQVITNLIAEFVNEGKNVLMVSEKKTALDVVYSRLGSLSKYTLLMDDVENKNRFYEQLERIMHIKWDYSNEEKEIDDIAASIDAKIKELESIADALYKISDFGIEPYKLFLINKKIDKGNVTEERKAKTIHDALTEKVRGIKYPRLKAIHHLFENKDLLCDIDAYKMIGAKTPWIKSFKENMTDFELMDLNDKLDAYIRNFNEYQSKFIKVFSHRKIKTEALNILREFTCVPDVSLKEIMLTNPMEIKNGLINYATYNNNKVLYTSLRSDEIAYIEVLFSIRTLCDSLKDTNDELFNEIIYENILKFQNDNMQILSSINQYEFVIMQLSELIDAKKELTRKRLEKILGNSIYEITTSKRAGEIGRIVEGKRRWNVNRFVAKYNLELFNAIKVWLLTPEVVSEIMPLEAGKFDLVIFDEASQMYVERGLPAIQRAKKVVIAGDHKQLRPSSLGVGRYGMDEDDEPIEEDNSAALEEESLLDLARFKYQDVMLNFHYRARYEELIAFSNYAFYKGRLYVAPNTKKPEKPPIEYHKIENALWVNRENRAEAEYVVNLLEDTLKNRKNEESIGIITFNTNQRDLIMDVLDERCAKDLEFAARVRSELDRKCNEEDIGLFIKNIESVQGDERDIVIFSIGYARNENGRIERRFGWLNQKGGENRLNVAISRAKTKIHIVASFDPDELQVEDTKNDGPKILKKYLQYSLAVSEENRDAAQQILYSFGDTEASDEEITFDSDFEKQVYDMLSERLHDNGYVINTQVGIGGYSIDLAIKKDGKYILGIECDGRTYHSSKSARERDYHRQKYLESRGWRIHRIWSTNWWNNPKSEINKICNIVENHYG